MPCLYETIRPRTLGDIVGQPRAVAQAEKLIARGVGGRSIWISGPSGSGKTTLARILAAQVADDFFTEECVADDLGAERLEGWIRSACLSAWGRGGRAFIVNEAHGLRANIQRKLDQWLEGGLPAHCVFVATTTNDGQESMFDGIDGGPLLSRFFRIKLTNQGLAEPAAGLLARVWSEQGGSGEEPDFLKIVREHKSNLRACLQALEGLL